MFFSSVLLLLYLLSVSAYPTISLKPIKDSSFCPSLEKAETIISEIEQLCPNTTHSFFVNISSNEKTDSFCKNILNEKNDCHNRNKMIKCIVNMLMNL